MLTESVFSCKLRLSMFSSNDATATVANDLEQHTNHRFPKFSFSPDHPEKSWPTATVSRLYRPSFNSRIMHRWAATDFANLNPVQILQKDHGQRQLRLYLQVRFWFNNHASMTCSISSTTIRHVATGVWIEIKKKKAWWSLTKFGVKRLETRSVTGWCAEIA